MRFEPLGSIIYFSGFCLTTRCQESMLDGDAPSNNCFLFVWHLIFPFFFFYLNSCRLFPLQPCMPESCPGLTSSHQLRGLPQFWSGAVSWNCSMDQIGGFGCYHLFPEWTSYFTLLNFGFFICKMESPILSSVGCCEDQQGLANLWSTSICEALNKCASTFPSPCADKLCFFTVM